MTLATGSKLGPYEIVGALGAGGMGEVYRARDTRLERTGAIKILPAHLSSDPVRRQRFEREAKTISSLNHPHICVLYDIGCQDGVDYLVMECVEGETLEKRLEKGPLPIEQVVKIGAEVADALHRAHRSGVVHRDLKPGNIMLTSTGAKLLDFGLAKLTAAPAVAATLTASAKDSPVTEQGMIVGTFQYMSPEQVEGKELDGRSDIFSFGAVLYEMVTGRRAFEGKSQLSVASAILEKEPEPISASKPMTPPALARLVTKCLAKDPDQRWQSASDLASELNWVTEADSPVREAMGVASGRGRWARTGWLLAATFFLLTAVGGIWWKASDRHPRAMYFHAPVPFPANDVALSPDGRMLAIAAYSAQTDSDVLWMYDVGGWRTSALDGTHGASYPFWSPDGKFIGFFADGKLKKVAVSGGQIEVLCDAPNGRGGAWNRDGVIVFTPDGSGGLSRVSASGGSPSELTKVDRSRFETTHRWPVFLPDGKHFLYLAANFSGNQESDAIFVGSLASQERQLLVNTSANVAYAEPGVLVYLRGKSLVARSFSLRRYVLSGEPQTLNDEVEYLPQVDRAVFSVSGGEVLVAQTGKGANVSRLTWFDRNGKSRGTVGLPGIYHNVRLSPDGHRIAGEETDSSGRKTDLWVHATAGDTATRLTFDPALHQTPIWSPDGKQILFSLSGGNRLYLKHADGSGSQEFVADVGMSLVNPWDWSRDGKYVLIRKSNELWYLLWPERTATPLLQAKWTVQNAQFSPDGRWVAYASNETGNMEIYVSPFPSANSKWQVSTAGGQEPRWRQDGKELFYVSAEGKMMSVEVKTGATFESGSPVALFQTHRRRPISGLDVFSYDVSGDGQRFLIATKVDEGTAAPLSIFLNWASEMEK